MNKSTDEKLALAFTAVVSLLFSGVAIGCMVYVAIVLTSVVLVRPAFSQSSTAAVRLEAGIAKEEVDGDLKSAIEIYRKVADDPSVGRDLRSKALLRLAGCYEKLGRQAQQVYEQIVRDYADQPAASQARTRLAALRQQEHPAPPTTMTVRKIEWSAVGQMSDSDTDGQRAVFADFTGSLFFGDLAGHSKRMIFKAEPDRAPDWTPARDFAIACIRLQSTPNHPGVLAVVKTDGTGYRELIRDDAQRTILGSWFDVTWSWDDRYLLVRNDPQPNASRKLWLVNVANGQRRELLSIDAGYFSKAVFSPDGRFIAYEIALLPDQAETSRVFVMPIQGGHARQVYESVPKPAQNGLAEVWTLLDWTADGHYLALADAPRGKTALYLLPVQNGAATGNPVFIRYGEFASAYMTAAGALVYPVS